MIPGAGAVKLNVHASGKSSGFIPKATMEQATTARKCRSAAASIRSSLSEPGLSQSSRGALSAICGESFKPTAGGT